MPLLTRLARLSEELGIYLVVDLETERGKEGFNALVALSPDGRVVGVHHKFELFEGERGALTPGDDVDAFDTPFGRVGLLVCADVYGAVRLHERLARDLDVDIVAYSAAWTVEGATHWPSAFAHDWGVFVVAANGSTGEGRGSGVFDRKGAALALSNRFGSPVIVARLPVEPLAGDSGKRGTR
jgi:predicted amidohydrolase